MNEIAKAIMAGQEVVLEFKESSGGTKVATLLTALNGQRLGLEVTAKFTVQHGMAVEGSIILKLKPGHTGDQDMLLSLLENVDFALERLEQTT